MCDDDIEAITDALFSKYGEIIQNITPALGRIDTILAITLSGEGG